MDRKIVEEVQVALEMAPVDFGGGCSVGKALVLAELVTRGRLRVSADIGVYRGRSLFPLAIAHRHAGGIAYGIDPWHAGECTQHDRPDLKEALDAFVAGTDFEEIYIEVCAVLDSLGLRDSCSLLRMRSDTAIHYFEDEGIRFGLVHIDGNHDTALVTSDFELYFPRLEEGGFMVLDDISWDSVKPALAMAESKMTNLFARSDSRADYAVYQKARPGIMTRRLSKRLARTEECGRSLEDCQRARDGVPS